MFHALLELAPGMLWKNVDARMRSVLKENFNLVPLNSFGWGRLDIIASEQNPFFWNFRRERAVRLFELLKIRKEYKLTFQTPLL